MLAVAFAMDVKLDLRMLLLSLSTLYNEIHGLQPLAYSSMLGASAL